MSSMSVDEEESQQEEEEEEGDSSDAEFLEEEEDDGDSQISDSETRFLLGVCGGFPPPSFSCHG